MAGYTARNRLDAATLDRFAVVEMVYDEELEAAVALGTAKEQGKRWEQAENPAEMAERWVAWVRKVRALVGSSVLVSPRASILGVRALRAGVPPAEVVEALVFKLVADDTKRNVVGRVGGFE